MGSEPGTSGGRRFGYVLAYVLAGGLVSLSLVWLVAKMTRTEAADFRILVMSGAIVVCMLAVVAGSWRAGRRR